MRTKLQIIVEKRKKRCGKLSLMLSFNFVDLCHDAAIQTSLIALTVPSVVATHQKNQRKNLLFFEFAAPKLANINYCS